MLGLPRNFPERTVTGLSESWREIPHYWLRRLRPTRDGMLTALFLGAVMPCAWAVNMPEPPEWAYAKKNLTPPSEVFLRAGTAATWNKQSPLPGQDALFPLVKNRQALIRLGKALFWDSRVGGDGNACASCHFAAGADNRVENAINPGLLSRVDASPIAPASGTSLSYEPLPGNSQGSAGSQLKASQFPFRRWDEISFVNVLVPHLLLPPNFIEGTGSLTPPFGLIGALGKRPDPAMISLVDDVVSSQGTFAGKFHPDAATLQSWCGQKNEDFSAAMDAVFSATAGGGGSGTLYTRKVEPRNTPTVIGACRNKKNFWDGRAKNVFNGVNPNGLADPNARIWWWENGGLGERQLAITMQSCASQAVGPIQSTLEMTCSGQTIPDVGRKLLDTTALGQQVVAATDSVLGALRNGSGNGLAVTYRQMVREAFNEVVWGGSTDQFGNRTPQINSIREGDSFTTDEANFSLIFGLSVAAYEETLEADKTRFDTTLRVPTPNPSTTLVPLANNAKPGQLLRQSKVTTKALPIFLPSFVVLEGQCYNTQSVLDVNRKRVTIAGTCIAGANQQIITVPDYVVMGMQSIAVPGDIVGWTAQETQGMDLFMGNYSIRNPPIALNAAPLVPAITSQKSCKAPNLWDPIGNQCVSTTVTVWDPARNTCAQQDNARPAKTGGCVLCHDNTEFSSAAVSSLKAGLPVVLPPGAACPPVPGPIPVAADVMPMLNRLIDGSPIISPNHPLPSLTRNIVFNLYDIGWYDIGVTPNVVSNGVTVGQSYDIGAGAEDEFGNPISFSQQIWNALSYQANSSMLPDPLAAAYLVDLMGGFSNPLLGCGQNPSLLRDPFAPRALCQIDPFSVETNMTGAFKTPTLRNVGLTTPFFHNGGTLTLRDVVHHYNLGCLYWTNTNIHPECIPRLLTAAEEMAIATFLNNVLTDSRVATRKAPFDGPSLEIPDGYVRDIDGKLNPSQVNPLLAQEKMTSLPAVGSSGDLVSIPTTEYRLNRGVNAAGR